MKHPLDYFKSQEVAHMLSELYKRNFKKAGANPDLGVQFVDYVWTHRDQRADDILYADIREIYRDARRQRNLKKLTETPPWELFEFEDTGIFLDIGANTLFTINLLAQMYSEMRFIGVDIVPQQKEFIFPERGNYIQIDPDNFILPIEDDSIDIVNIKFVLHHFKDNALIQQALSEIHRVLKKGGQFILWEETFDTSFDTQKIKEQNNQLGIETDYELSEQLYQLPEDKRWELIIVNDWMINFAHKHIPWTYQYYTWPQWVGLTSSVGFTLEKTINFGLRNNGLLSQGAHMMGLFRK